MSHLSFETKRLILRPTTIEDAAFIYELLNSPKWIEFIGDRHVYTVDQAKQYIADKMLPQLTKMGFGNYTLIRKDNSAKIGTCGIYKRDGLKDFDIGFALLPAYEKQGYAYEAACKIIDVAFNEFKIDTIKAITTKENKSSQKLISKLGLKYIGTTILSHDDVALLLYEKKKDTL